MHVDIKGGNGNIVFDEKNAEATKYLRNTSSKEKTIRFKKEIEILQELSKSSISNIVEVHSVNIDDNVSKCFITMKKYDGNLYDLLPRTKGNLKFTIAILLPIVETLNTLATRDVPIYHRDIKPDNILYEYTDGKITLFLADFGLCYLKDDNERLTEEITAIGPRMFIAPEYEKGKVEDVDEKGDIFSIGKLLWFMINGNTNEYLPSNFWFLDEYNLSKKFNSDSEMIKANIIISSCLSSIPSERNNYGQLITKMTEVLNDNIVSDKVLKTKEYEEKRKLELLEIKEQNKLLVNYFSIEYLAVLKLLIEKYNNFDMLVYFYNQYESKRNINNNFVTSGVDKNIESYLYSGTFDRIYISINYHRANDTDKYCNISLDYSISNGKNDSVKFYYDSNKNIFIKTNEYDCPYDRKFFFEFVEKMIENYIS